VPSAANFIHLDGNDPPEPLYLRQPDIKPQHKIDMLNALTRTSAVLLAELHGECFNAGWSEKDFMTLFDGPAMTAHVIVHAQEPAGFVLSRRAADEAEIITICVRPPLRRKGFGRLLLQHLERGLRAAGTRSLFLEVGAENAAARALYRRLGFHDAGTRPRYYGNREDAIIMRKGL
jgi:[ribosomal protein S18]-alanine N-acetyltransferase